MVEHKCNSMNNAVKQVKGNIPINNNLLNKYLNVREIFDNEKNLCNDEIYISSKAIDFVEIDFYNFNITQLKNIANQIFSKYNSCNGFYNINDKIVVSKSGINESVEKKFNNRAQRNLLKEHLIILSNLGNIIEYSKLINQALNMKNNFDINYWNYYIAYLNIDGNKYMLVFDVRSMKDGQNQYRVQRLEKI